MAGERREGPLTELPYNGQESYTQLRPFPTPVTGFVVERTITYFAETREDLERQLAFSLPDGEFQPGRVKLRVTSTEIRRL